MLHVPGKHDKHRGWQQQMPCASDARHESHDALGSHRVFWRLPQWHLPGRNCLQGTEQIQDLLMKKLSCLLWSCQGQRRCHGLHRLRSTHPSRWAYAGDSPGFGCFFDRVFVCCQVGVNASSQVILERLIRSDTAAAFNITAQDVNVTGITQVC